MLSSADDAVIQGPTLLIVEDDVGFARALAMLARDAGFIPTVAGTVSQAKQHAGRQRFDITVIDVNLPDGSGLALFECSELSQARRVLITGAYNVHNMLRAARLHVPDVLTNRWPPTFCVTCLPMHARSSTLLPSPPNHSTG